MKRNLVTLWILALGLGMMRLPEARADFTLTPGRYSAVLNPAVDFQTAATIEEQLNRLPGIQSARVDTTLSTLVFTVSSPVDSSRIKAAVQSAAQGYTLLDPVQTPD